MQSYFQMIEYASLFTVISSIMGFDYFNQYKISNRDDNLTLDIFLKPESQEYNGQFVVHISKDEVVKYFDGATNYHVFGNDVATGGSEFVKNICVYYYFFLAEMKLFRNFDFNCKDKRIMNLFEFWVGIH